MKLVGSALALCFIILCVGLQSTMVGTAVPTMTADYDALDDIGWYASTYLICNAYFHLLFSKLYARFPNKKVYVGAWALFEIGNILCGTAPISIAFIFGRAITGAGAAGLLRGNAIIVAAVVPLERRSTYSIIISLVYSTGSALGNLAASIFPPAL